MSAGADLLARARGASNASTADTLAVQAIQADPDLGAAYALRGRLAAERGDVVAAAHHYRAAYGRGEHGPETRAALAACVAAAGDRQQAARIAQGARLPAFLETFGELVAMQGGGLRGVLSSPMPPRGAPALLPGEAAPTRARSLPPRAASLPPRAEPAARMVSRGRSRTVQLGAPEPEPAQMPPPRPRPPSRPAPAPAPSASSWLEDSHTERTSSAAPSGGAASWLEDAYFSDVSGGSVDAGGLELAWDPGELQVEMRSPVTGRVIHHTELVAAERGAVMPDFGDPDLAPAAEPAAPPPPAGPDPFEAHAPLTAAGIANLRLALALPGPVITAAGQRPQQLGKHVALGLTTNELVLGEPQGRTPPVRLGLGQLKRLDVVRGGEQLSFLLADGRQLHLDLRDLLGRAPTLARSLIDELTRSLEALGSVVQRR